MKQSFQFTIKMYFSWHMVKLPWYFIQWILWTFGKPSFFTIICWFISLIIELAKKMELTITDLPLFISRSCTNDVWMNFVNEDFAEKKGGLYEGYWMLCTGQWKSDHNIQFSTKDLFGFGSMYFFPVSMEIVLVFQNKTKKHDNSIQ